MSRYGIRPLDAHADTAYFDCGDTVLNDYLRRYAAQDVKRGVARAFFASTHDHGASRAAPENESLLAPDRSLSPTLSRGEREQTRLRDPHSKAAPARIAGFFTLSAASIRAETLPDAWRRKLPRYPVPVALLGRLAVDKRFQGQGLASILLADACRKVSAASQTLAVAAILVDAKSSAAADFYRHFGFIELPGQAQRLILPRSHFAALI
jgi:GNAT superfamily N-acetyltransferase